MILIEDGSISPADGDAPLLIVASTPGQDFNRGLSPAVRPTSTVEIAEGRMNDRPEVEAELAPGALGVFSMANANAREWRSAAVGLEIRAGASRCPALTAAGRERMLAQTRSGGSNASRSS